MGFSCGGCRAAYGPPVVYFSDRPPVINEENATVNGIHYDNETEDCWEVITKITYTNNTITETGYYWNTEFSVVAQFEEAMYANAQAGRRSSWKYRRASEFKDSESCLANNEKD